MKKLEFSEMSAGMIEDLAKIQSKYRMEQLRLGGSEYEEDDERKRLYYEPLKPFELPITSKTPHIENGRVEIRLVSLMDSLRKIG